MLSEVGRIWLAAARAQLYRALEMCIEKDPQGNPKLREAYVDHFKLFTAMALAATALLSRYMSHNTPTNVIMEADGGCQELGSRHGGWHRPRVTYPHPTSAAATLKAGFLRYPNIPWGVDQGTGPP
eukprot:jgi/Tetstr1/445713/TSEL_003512.t1